MRMAIGAAVACLTIIGAAAAGDVRASIKQQTSIPAQPLGSALQALAHERDFQIVYMAQLEALPTKGASGDLTIDEALRLLLEGTGQTFRYADDKTVTIVPIATGPAVESREDTALAGKEARKDRGFWERFRVAQSDATSAAAEGDSEDAKLDEIVVTAQKRAQNLQDVPISVAAIGQDEIERRGLRGMGDYLSAVPGASLIEINSTHNAVVIRGIDTGPEQQNFGAGTTVATYFGETPTTNSAGLIGGSGIDIKLVDIERIEILRGPQGTAFGNSSLGGVLRTIPAAPRLDRFSGKAAADFSYTDGDGGANNMIQAVLNAPLVQDRLAVRLVGYRYKNSGYYENLAGSDPTMQAYAASLGPQAQSLATSQDDRGRNTQVGGRISMLWQATEDLKLTLSYLTQELEDGGFSSSFGLGDGYGYAAFRILPSRSSHNDGDSSFESRIGIGNAQLEYSLGWADLMTSASWTDTDLLWVRGAGINVPSDLIIQGEHNAFAGEARLASKLDGPVQFLAGIYHENLKDSNHEDYGALETPSLNPWGDGVNSTLGIFLTTRKLKQDAVFGELSYSPIQSLTMTVGTRHYKYDRDSGLESSGWFTGIPLDSPSLSLLSLNKSGESYKANLSYKPTESGMLYASWAEGFRLGRPSAGLPQAVCDTDNDGLVDGSDISIASTRVIDDDTLESFEIGGKFKLLDGRVIVNTSVYQIDWTGVPTNSIATCSRSTFFYVANAGEARSRGVEFQSSYSLTKGLRVDFGGSFTNAELTKDVPTLNAISGDRLPGSPKWIGSLGLQYDFSMGSIPAFTRVDSSYRGKFYSDFARNAATQAGGYFRADLRAGIRVQNFDAELFVTNLTNVDDYVWRGLGNTSDGFGYLMRPRTVGIQLGYHF